MSYVNSGETIGPTAKAIEVEIPPGAAEGQIGLVALWCGANAISDTFTGPGFTELVPNQGIGAHGVLTVFGKQLTGADVAAGSWEFDWETAAASEALVCLNSGRDSSSNPYSIAVGDTSSGTTQPPPLSGTDLAGDDLVYFVVEYTGESGLTVPAFTNRIDDTEFGMHLWTADDVPAGLVTVQSSAATPPTATQWWPALIGIKKLAVGPIGGMSFVDDDASGWARKRAIMGL